MATLLIAGCGSSPKPEETVKSFLNAMKKADFEGASKYLDKQDSELNFKEFKQEEALKKLLSKIDYEIISSNEDGDKGTVKTKVTAPDMTLIVGEIFKEAFAAAFTGGSGSVNENMFNDTLIKQLDKKDLKMTSNEIEIKLTKKANKWLIVTDDALANAITGHLVKAFEGMSPKK